MITDAEKHLIRESFGLVVPVADQAMDVFYDRLFELAPHYRSLFPSDLAEQKRKLLVMLQAIVESLDFPEPSNDRGAKVSDLEETLLALGRRHRELYAVPDAAYQTVGAALLYTLERGLGELFNAPRRAAWTRLYTVVADTMKQGAAPVPSHFASGEINEANTQTRVRPNVQVSSEKGVKSVSRSK